jgi:Ca2+-transporting ATPase
MAACKRAGIRVIVITGDNQLTAEAICRTIGVLSLDPAEAKKHSITGREFAALPKKDQLAFLGSDDMSGRVFSRAEPRHKQDIVRLLKECGEVTAMTGDGSKTGVCGNERLCGKRKSGCLPNMLQKSAVPEDLL